MRLTTTARLLVLILSCPLLVGCVTEVQRPTASVRQMSLGDVTPQGFTMNFGVEVDNPNPVALPVADVDYNLRLVGEDFLDGKADPDASIPANGSMPVTLPVHVSFENLLTISDGIRKTGGDIPYELEAGLEFGGGSALLGRPVRVPVRFSGTIPVRQLLKDPKVLLRSSAARELARDVLGGLLGR
jgi:LEA14-like dessication related protein